jgi:glucosamine kinase
VCGDTEVAFAGAPGAPTDGLVLVAGTGAAAARLAGGRQTETADGDGWLLGDGGSGFWIGRRSVRTVLAALDGRGQPTLLTAAVAGRYLGAAVPAHPADRPAALALRARIAQAVRARPPLDLAGVCPLVTTAADRGDEVARDVLAGAVTRLCATLHTLAPRPDEVLVTTGGLLGPDGALLAPLTRRLAPAGLRPVPVPDGLAGAVALARRMPAAGARRTDRMS